MRVLKKVSRSEVYKLITEVRLKHSSSYLLESWLKESEFHEQTLIDCSKESLIKIVFEQIQYEYGSAQNGFLAQIYETISGEHVDVTGEALEYFPCPCCELITLTEAYDIKLGTGYDICPHCNWEDDGTTSRDVGSGPNRGSMDDYLVELKKRENSTIEQRWTKKSSHV